jgi:hypothetical protein
MVFEILQANKVDGLWHFQGESNLVDNLDPSVYLWYDFEMQEVVIE